MTRSSYSDKRKVNRVSFITLYFENVCSYPYLNRISSILLKWPLLLICTVLHLHIDRPDFSYECKIDL